jgi:copper oxidase (laccase) domain-containing protein
MLDASGVCRSAFITQVPGIDVSSDKAEALRRLEAAHGTIRRKIGLADFPLITAEQIHGDQIAVIDVAPNTEKQFQGCDALITNLPGVVLGVHVADCCAVYIVDPKKPAVALAHSGKKGTELRIVAKTIDALTSRFGSRPRDLLVQLSPCIRPPHYEVDFAAEIVRQCESIGVEQISDSGICTACDLTRYYSYRAEKGRTGRMLALLALNNMGLGNSDQDSSRAN